MRLFTGAQYVDDESGLNPDDWDYSRPRLGKATPSFLATAPRSQILPYGVDEDTSAFAPPANARSIHSLHDLPTTHSTPHPAEPSLQQQSSTSGRHLRPRYLCVIDKAVESGYRVVLTRDDPGLYTLPYIFISYTRKHFYTQISADTSLSDQERRDKRTIADRDSRALTSLAICAAVEADVPAFWIDFECVQPEMPGDAEASRSMEDVYRICDIVRASHSMAIMVGPGVDEDLNHETSENIAAAQQGWLYEWGDRLWTLPEALLCPSNHGIIIYSTCQPEAKVEKVEKRNLAVHVWRDAAFVGQLIDHYEGSVHLTQLQLVTVALEALQRRQTVSRMSADVIYALMGLMRERLRARPNDSAFQAFARLSLANDSQSPLERIFCMRPISQSAAWHKISDF